ncbi:hypothetical protein HanIR_Chr06g0270841 [Helianthus annuus]|nr:hypothetical protein HanIR_Chr06g0270841 [Helianthus annuus]
MFERYVRKICSKASVRRVILRSVISFDCGVFRWWSLSMDHPSVVARQPSKDHLSVGQSFDGDQTDCWGCGVMQHDENKR